MYNRPYSCLLDDTDSQFPDFLHRASFLCISEKKKNSEMFKIKSHMAFNFLFLNKNNLFIFSNFSVIPQVFLLVTMHRES